MDETRCDDDDMRFLLHIYTSSFRIFIDDAARHEKDKINVATIDDVNYYFRYIYSIAT